MSTAEKAPTTSMKKQLAPNQKAILMQVCDNDESGIQSAYG